MKVIGKLALIAVCGLLAAGCGGGDINIEPQTVDNSTDNSVNNSNNTGATNPNEACASYVNSGGQTIEGSFDGQNCRYSPAFADAGNNITVDLNIPALTSGGAHIFAGSLFIGETCDTDQCLVDNGLQEGGDGPVLTIEAGATLAWQSSSNFLIINRGSQIFAVGRQDAPITFTSVSDVNGTLPSFDAVQQWGGIVINGFGITNKCAYTPANPASEAELETTDCHVDAEGAAGLDESQYGGDNNNDSSGRLEYVVVKHTGATVGNGDELNGISFGGVGRNTIVENLQMYATFDDGIEMFGGAVNFTNFIALYVRDDSIDIDEGWSGTITNALVIQAETIGNHCIEADGIGSHDDLTDAEREARVTQGINSSPTVNNLTCIISPSTVQGDFDQGAGWRLREGLEPTINDSIIITAAGPDDPASTNYCVRIEDDRASTTIDINASVFACEERTNGGTVSGGQAEEDFLLADGDNVFATIIGVTNPGAAVDTDLQLLEGTPLIYSVDYDTMVVDGANLTSNANTPVNGSYVGGLSLSIPDWTAGWSFGIDPITDPDGVFWFE